MADKHIAKAEKKVVSAVTVFDKSIAEINKAQDILLTGIAVDQNEIERLTAEIASKQTEIDLAEMRIKEKEIALTNNHKLLQQLQQFTQGV